jgi:hypothetical protein
MWGEPTVAALGSPRGIQALDLSPTSPCFVCVTRSGEPAWRVRESGYYRFDPTPFFARSLHCIFCVEWPDAGLRFARGIGSSERRIMLPFTKRPGRGDESGDEDVVTKDDIVKPATTPPAAKAGAAGRAKFSSINDEEMTTLMPAKSVTDALSAARSSPRPAAGAPPPSRSAPSSKNPPPPSASRSGKFAAQEDEEEDGRTVVRGAPKIVKRTNAPHSQPGGKMGGMPTMPTTISPAAVIKATLESARAGVKPRTDHLMAGPPQDLLEDLADRHPADVGAEHTAILKSPTVPPPGMVQGVKALSTQMLQPQGIPQGTIPPGSARPLTNPPPATASGGYAAQSGGYAAQYNGPVPSGSVSVPGVSMSQSLPAHFMVPQAPYSDGRIDPPGTAVTARTKVAGRPATSWAMAVAAFGLFVGLGAVAVMQGNGNGFAETGASFVDPSRAAGGKAAVAAAAQPAAATPTPVPVAANDQAGGADRVGVPPVAVPAAPPPVATDTVAAPAVTTPAVAAAPAAAPAAPAAPAVAAAPARPAAAPVAVAAPVARPQPAPVSRPVRPVPAPAPAAEEAPVAAAPAKPAKGAKPGAKGGSGDSAVDEEQRKALKALQESQLETPF